MKRMYQNVNFLIFQTQKFVFSPSPFVPPPPSAVQVYMSVLQARCVWSSLKGEEILKTSFVS